MKKQILTILMISLFIFQIVSISALTALEAKQDWLDAKQESLSAQLTYRNARAAYLTDRTPEKEQIVINTGKDALNAALDEAETWLIWKKIEAQENNEIPSDLKQTILNDIEKNLNKIDELRTKVEEIDTQIELGIVFLEMAGKYFELLSDVAKDHGLIWIYIAEKRIDTIEQYEEDLREAAQGNSEATAKLDQAKIYIEEAKTNVNSAEIAYNAITYPGTPLIKFSEGNNYLRAARLKMINAVQEIKSAHALLIK